MMSLPIREMLSSELQHRDREHGQKPTGGKQKIRERESAACVCRSPWSSAKHPVLLKGSSCAPISTTVSIHGEYWGHSGSGQRLRRARLTQPGHWRVDFAAMRKTFSLQRRGKVWLRLEWSGATSLHLHVGGGIHATTTLTCAQDSDALAVLRC
jgi:hypothetical protein